MLELQYFFLPFLGQGIWKPESVEAIFANVNAIGRQQDRTAVGLQPARKLVKAFGACTVSQKNFSRQFISDALRTKEQAKIAVAPIDAVVLWRLAGKVWFRPNRDDATQFAATELHTRWSYIFTLQDGRLAARSRAQRVPRPSFIFCSPPARIRQEIR